jgi:hypothetical protein
MCSGIQVLNNSFGKADAVSNGWSKSYAGNCHVRPVAGSSLPATTDATTMARSDELNPRPQCCPNGQQTHRLPLRLMVECHAALNLQEMSACDFPASTHASANPDSKGQVHWHETGQHAPPIESQQQSDRAPRRQALAITKPSTTGERRLLRKDIVDEADGALFFHRTTGLLNCLIVHNKCQSSDHVPNAAVYHRTF